LLDKSDHLISNQQSDRKSDHQPNQRLEQASAQLFEVLPEGHRAFMKQIVFARLRHKLGMDTVGGIGKHFSLTPSAPRGNKTDQKCRVDQLLNVGNGQV
jgi:hypothetical protein